VPDQVSRRRDQALCGGHVSAVERWRTGRPDIAIEDLELDLLEVDRLPPSEVVGKKD
jgi:hypothetical protein